jgi:hypothetical protein
MTFQGDGNFVAPAAGTASQVHQAIVAHRGSHMVVGLLGGEMPDLLLAKLHGATQLFAAWESLPPVAAVAAVLDADPPVVAAPAFAGSCSLPLEGLTRLLAGFARLSDNPIEQAEVGGLAVTTHALSLGYLLRLLRAVSDAGFSWMPRATWAEWEFSVQGLVFERVPALHALAQVRLEDLYEVGRPGTGYTTMVTRVLGMLQTNKWHHMTVTLLGLL